MCVPHRYWKENTENRHWSVILSVFQSVALLFLKYHCNLDKHTPLANHGFNCADWYVTVNITFNSQSNWLSPYQAVMRHSLTLLRFIIHRLAAVLCSDSKSCCQCTDYDKSIDEIAGKSNSSNMVKCSGEVQLFHPPINLKSRPYAMFCFFFFCGTGLSVANTVKKKIM